MNQNAGGGFQTKSVDHIGFVVSDIDKVMPAWSAMLGIGPWTIRETSGTGADGKPLKVRLAFAYLGSLELELIQPVEGKFLHAEFLETVGEGLHHLGVAVEDVDGETEKLVAQGARTVLHQPGGYSYLRFDDDGGVIFELMTKKGYDQRREAVGQG